MEEKNKKNNLGLRIALILLVILLLGAGFYAYNLNEEKKQTEQTLTEEKQQVIDELNALTKQYDKVLAENDFTNQELIDAKERIERLLDSLKTSKNSINNLWRYKKRYLDLKKEKEDLLAENELLRFKNDSLSATLDSTNVQLNESKLLSNTLQNQNSELINIVEDASELQIVGLVGIGILERRNGKQIPTERARRANRIKICYTVAKNTVAKASDKTLYVQVIDPNNNVLGEQKVVNYGSEMLKYSLESNFNYQNKNLYICEYITLKEKRDMFESGRYQINVFNDKEIISNSEFTLK